MILFIDMGTYTPGRAIRALDYSLGWATFILVLTTIVALPFIVLAVSGQGSVSLPSSLDGSYRVEFDDGRAIGISDGVALAYERFDIGEERDTLTGDVEFRAMVEVQRQDRDGRAVLGAMVALWLGAVWVGLLDLRSFVRSVAAGDPFAPDNARRLRRVGAAILAVPAVSFIGGVALRATFDADLSFVPELAVGGPSWVLILVGLFVLALAAPFAEASRLREFEQTTI